MFALVTVLATVCAAAAQQRSLATAVAAAGPAATTIDCTAPETLTLNLTLPANVDLRAAAGCRITLGNYNLVIRGELEAGPYQIFVQNGGGRVYFGRGPADALPQTRRMTLDYPEWWGARMDGTTDDTAAFQAAVDAFVRGGGTVRLGSSVSHESDAAASPYYLAGDWIIDQAVKVVGPASPGFNTEYSNGGYLVFAPGHGIFVASVEGDRENFSAQLTNIAVSCELNPALNTGNCEADAHWTGATSTITVSNPGVLAVGDLVTTAIGGVGALPMGTEVTRIAGQQVTLSHATTYWPGGTTVKLFVASTGAQKTTATTNYASCGLIDVANIGEFHVGEEIVAVDAHGVTQTFPYSYVASISTKDRMITVWGQNNTFNNAGCGDLSKPFRDDGVAVSVWPVPAAFNISNVAVFSGLAVWDFGGNGLDEHGTMTLPWFSDTNFNTGDNSQFFYVGGVGLDIQGGDANAQGYSNIALGYNGNACLHVTGQANTFTNMDYEECGFQDTLEPETGDNVYIGGYGEGQSFPSVLGHASTCTAESDYESSCGLGLAVTQTGRSHYAGYDKGRPETWLGSESQVTVRATLGSDCVIPEGAGEQNLKVGEPLTSSSGLLQPDTIVTALDTCGAGFDTVTLSKPVHATRDIPGVQIDIDVAPDYGESIEGGSAGAMSGVGSAASLADTGDSDHAMQWFWNPFWATAKPSRLAPIPFKWWTFGNDDWNYPNNRLAWALGVSDLSSTDATVPIEAPDNFLRTLKPLYVGSSFGDHFCALGNDARAGNWPADEDGTHQAFADRCDFTINASGQAPDLFGWYWSQGGKYVVPADGAGNATRALSATIDLGAAQARMTAPNDVVSGPQIPPGTYVVCVHPSGGNLVGACKDPGAGKAVLSNVAEGDSSGVALALHRYGKVHALDDTLTVAAADADRGVLNRADNWAVGDTVVCAVCAPGTYVAALAGTTMTLSQPLTNAAAGGTFTIYDALPEQVPAGPPGAAAQVALAWSLTTTAAASDEVPVAGLTASAHCSWSAANEAAAGDAGHIFLTPANDRLTVHHSAQPGESLTGLCTPR